MASMAANMASPNLLNGSSPSLNPQLALLDFFFPGFSMISNGISKYFNIDISQYITTLVACGFMFWASQFVVDYFWSSVRSLFMSTADIRTDDEMYNMVMAWVATQKFSQNNRRFIANTNTNSRAWFLYYDSDRDEDSDDDVDFEEDSNSKKLKKKALKYTPAHGDHYFWYKGRLMTFGRHRDNDNNGGYSFVRKENISISSFGRDPSVLKQLLNECRANYLKADQKRTLIFRAAMKPGSMDIDWVRTMSRVPRPFSTVVMDEGVKKALLEDMRDYLHPYTRRWYSNRGIPYRRGYLLYGPPGTGKSSLSFAIAGYFKLKIYIVSLNSPSMNEENLGTLFAELPKRCVVLLEDIDTAGLTHTRDTPAPSTTGPEDEKPKRPPTPVSAPVPATIPGGGKISLSALLNVIDGVASQEGRVLIMTTNHIDKLDDALIRPGRVDMTVKFDLTDKAVNCQLFRAIYTTMEGDNPPNGSKNSLTAVLPTVKITKESEKASGPVVTSEPVVEAEAGETATEELVRISALAQEFADQIPDYTFSPAEIQGYLLKHKRDPAAAVSSAQGWVQKKKNEKRRTETLLTETTKNVEAKRDGSEEKEAKKETTEDSREGSLKEDGEIVEKDELVEEKDKKNDIEEMS
jgi:chaperone BCS1